MLEDIVEFLVCSILSNHKWGESHIVHEGMADPKLIKICARCGRRERV